MISTLRTHLRNATGQIHAQLDALVGEFSDLARYKIYLKGLYAFRAPIEWDISSADLPASYGDWRPRMIGLELRQDLEDLLVEAGRPERLAPVMARSESWWAGTLYVLEGSSIGARLLHRRAHALGLSDKHGARHLAAQTGRRDTWPTFLGLIESSTAIDPNIAGEAAQHAFSLALNAFAKEADVCDN